LCAVVWPGATILESVANGHRVTRCLSEEEGKL